MRGLSFIKAKNKPPKDRSADSQNEEDGKTNIIQKYWRAFLARK